MGSGQIFLNRIKLVRVEAGTSRSEKFPPKNPNFYLWIKKSYWVGSKNMRVKAGSATFHNKSRM